MKTSQESAVSPLPRPLLLIPVGSRTPIAVESTKSLCVSNETFAGRSSTSRMPVTRPPAGAGAFANGTNASTPKSC